MTASAKPILDSAKQRRRGALSCAECRRLKLRCDRQFPCHSCRKRGCAAICPDGALTTGKGNRFILANTEELHDKIEELQERIVQLENALATLHNASDSSGEPHPLLTEELLNIKTPMGAEIVGSSNPRHSSHRKALQDINEAEDNDELNDSFGTLALGEGSSKTKYFGLAAGAQFLLGEDGDEEEQKPNIDEKDPRTTLNNSLPPELAHMARSYPFSILGSDWPAARDQLRRFLPEAHLAWSLSEQYFEHGSWLYIPVSRVYYVERIFTPILDPAYDDPKNPSKPQPTPADYALLYIVLALGTILDLNRPPYRPEAEHYHALARASLGAVNPLVDSLTGVQALLLMSYYNQMSDHKDAPGRSWSLSGLACKMATAIGLHRDGKRWNLEPEEIHRRRTVFWEVTMFDTWSSQAMGRPPTMINPHVDAAYPADVPEFFDANGNPEPSFQRNKYVYVSTLHEILNEAFGAKRPTYDTVLRLDRRIRDLEVPLSLQVGGLNSDPNGPEPPAPCSRAQILQTHTTFVLKEILLIYLHRGYLAKALADFPDDPFKSRYAASVLAAHRSSCAVLVGVRNAYALLPRLAPRIYFLWVHGFSAAIVLATIVIRSPSSHLVPSSLKELDIACELFDRAKEGCRPARALPLLLKLRNKAHQAYEEFQAGKPRFLSPPIDTIEDASAEDDLTMLAGKSRLVRVKGKTGTTSASSPPSHHDETSSMDESPKPAPSDYHPALREYLKAYNQQLNDRGQNVPGNTPPPSYRNPGGNIASSSRDVPQQQQQHQSQSQHHNILANPTPPAEIAGPFEYAYTYGLPEQTQANIAMSRASMQQYAPPSVTQQQYQQQQQAPRGSHSHPGGPPPSQSPQHLRQHSAQPGQHQHPSHSQQQQHGSSAQQQLQILTSPSSSSHHGPATQSPTTEMRHMGPHRQPSQPQQQQLPTPSSSRGQYFPDYSPQTPFSAFEPAAYGTPRREGVPTSGNVGGNGGVTNGGQSHPTAPGHHFTGLDTSLAQAPETMDLGWQFMSDLRPYL